jgi:hypothetical protein
MASNSQQVVKPDGTTQAQEQVEIAADEFEAPPAVELPEERITKFRSPGFARLRLEWRNRDEATIVAAVQRSTDDKVVALFRDAYEVMYMIYEAVRDAEVDPATGEPKSDRHGFVIWKQNEYGGYDDRFNQLTVAQREDFMFLIRSRLFDWEQRAARLWGDSMLAKAMWEETWAIAYDAPREGTIDDRKAVANKKAAEEKYFAIVQTLLSRKADALVRTMDRLGQTLKDSLVGYR